MFLVSVVKYEPKISSALNYLSALFLALSSCSKKVQ